MDINNDNDDVDEDVGEEEDFDGMELAAGVANPVQRKQKKGLDFSRWQEIVKNDGNSALYEKKKEIYSTGLEVGQKEREITSNKLSRQIADPDDAKLQYMTMDNKASKEGTEDISRMASAKEIHGFRHAKNENIGQTKQCPPNGIAKSEESTIVEEATTWQNGSSKEVDLKMQNMQKSYMASGFTAQKLVGGEEESLQSEIDAENRAQLAKMSVDEIAEAQSEIMAKLNPELINALKKRGQAKVKRQKFSLSDVTGSASDSMQHEIVIPKSSHNTITDDPVKILPGDTLKDNDDKVSPNVSPDNCSMWDAWSKRVEHVRDMRFSLDGYLVGSDFAHVSDTGKASK